MSKSKKRYDSKYKVTRIHLGDYLALKRISQVTGISMAEALHRLIEHQAQLALPGLRVTGVPTVGVTGKPTLRVAGLKPAVRVTGKPAVPIAPVTTIATNGSKAAAFRIKQGVVKYD